MVTVWLEQCQRAERLVVPPSLTLPFKVPTTGRVSNENIPMPDPLYLSVWFSTFEVDDMLPHALSVMRQFSFSVAQPGITYLALHPVSWNEPTILERRFRPGVSPEEAVLIASDLLHEDYAYLFEALLGFMGAG